MVHNNFGLFFPHSTQEVIQRLVQKAIPVQESVAKTHGPGASAVGPKVNRAGHRSPHAVGLRVGLGIGAHLRFPRAELVPWKVLVEESATRTLPPNRA